MNIGVYDPYLDDLGGGEKYMMKIAECLSGEHSVSVFWDNPQDLQAVAKRFILDLSRVVLTSNIFSKNTSLINRLLVSSKFDAIFLLSDGSIPALMSKKLFVHIQQPLPSGVLSSIKTSIKMKRVNKIFCNSYFTKDFIEQKYQNKTIVIYPPIILSPEKKEKENIILHVGRYRARNTGLDDYKKQSVMIDEFINMVDNGFSKWKFILGVSVNPEQKEDFSAMEKKVKGYPIEFHINKTNDELWNLYSRAKIYWHASGFGEDIKKHPEFAEHFGMSTVEAMGAGAVPVVINAGGQREIVENEVSGLVWNTIDELQEKTIELTINRVLWQRLSEGAKKRASFFSGDRFCDEVSQLLKE